MFFSSKCLASENVYYVIIFHSHFCIYCYFLSNKELCYVMLCVMLSWFLERLLQYMYFSCLLFMLQSLHVGIGMSRCLCTCEIDKHCIYIFFTSALGIHQQSLPLHSGRQTRNLISLWGHCPRKVYTIFRLSSHRIHTHTGLMKFFLKSGHLVRNMH